MPKPVENFKKAMADTIRQIGGALVEREAAELQLAEINGRLEDLRDAARSLGKLCGIDPEARHPDLFPETTEPEMGFTDAVREVFKRLPPNLRMMDALSVRDHLQELGFSLEKYRNPLAVIHTILRRLHAQGELDRVVYPEENAVVYGLKRGQSKE